MRSTLVFLVACAFVLLAGACSTSKPAASSGDDGGADAGSLVDASFQMQMNVPAGGELFPSDLDIRWSPPTALRPFHRHGLRDCSIAQLSKQCHSGNAELPGGNVVRDGIHRARHIARPFSSLHV